ncbi:MAG: glutamine-hydrolyzing GMP synthase, partial [Guyparkeria sp.]
MTVSPTIPHPDIHAERILILDFGSQYTQLIARRVRESRVYCEIHSWDVDNAFVRNFNPTGIILSGGPESVIDPQNAPAAPEMVFTLDVPVLGICYGMQTMAAQLGGKVENASHQEFGFAKVRARGHTALLKDIEDEVTEEGFGLLDVWMSHGDHVVELPEGFKLMASSDNAPIAGMADESRHFYGLQFHPEVTHTRQGARIIHRFVRDICDTQGLWRSEAIIETMIEQ